ncbi:ETEC_3214 domain-containing protein [Herbiconiux sp. P17]|uniref:ETEC_3214 domain-containing protein n=1 Tax=Herbiconiux wuyangfengii TaxID=3342794 RepID=UPI0035BB554C
MSRTPHPLARPAKWFLNGGKAITWCAGLLAAISALVLFVPNAVNTVFWRPVEYDLLNRIHAGDSTEFVTSLLGQPALVEGIAGGSGLTQSVYLRRDHSVMTVADDAGRVVLYSVLSCDPEFAPTFTTPIRSTVRLQDRPLREAETVRNASADEMLNDRQVVAVPPLSVSSLDQLIEVGIQSGSNAARTQSWFVGINGACADTVVLAEDLPLDSNQPTDASIAALRSSTAANFYAETATEVEASIQPTGEIALGPYTGVPLADHLDLYVSPHVFDLPIDRVDRSGTRTF